jgi:hypothetical protein
MRRLLPIVVVLVARVAHAGPSLLDEASRNDAAVEERVHRAAAAVLMGNGADANASVREFEGLDQQRVDAGLRPTGLTDAVRLMAASLVSTRDARRVALEDVLDADPDPVVEKLARHALENEDAAAAERLIANDAHNRRASLVNDAVRPFGVFTGAAFLAALNPFLIAGSAVDAVATTAVNLWSYNRLSPPEREALARYKTLLRRDNLTNDAPDIVRAVQQLGKKRAEALCTETVNLGTNALDDDDLDRARFYLTNAQRLDGCAEETDEPLDDLAAAMARRSTAEEAARWPADEPLLPEPGLEADDYHAVAVATALGDPQAMMATSQRFQNAHPDSDLVPGAQLSAVVARDMSGHRVEARDTLKELSDDDSGVGRQAAALLASPEFNRLDALDEAESRHTREVAKYVLLGGTDGRSALYGAMQLGAQGAQAAQSLGIFNMIGVATRAWKAWRSDPASNDEIIQRGEELLAREPDSPDAPEVHERLSSAYERAGNYERALMHSQAVPEPDQKRIKKLQDKLADTMLEKVQGSPAEHLLLASIAEHFPESDAAEKARERLKDRPGPGALPLDRELLQANPVLLGPAGLDLDPGLLDGDKDNGELADKGVSLERGQLTLTLLDDEDESGERKDTRTLSADQYQRARAAAEEVLYAKVLTTGDLDPEVGKWEKYVPIYIQGSLGEEGFSVAPSIKMRRYKSPDSKLYE